MGDPAVTVGPAVVGIMDAGLKVVGAAEVELEEGFLSITVGLAVVGARLAGASAAGPAVSDPAVTGGPAVGGIVDVGLMEVGAMDVGLYDGLPRDTVGPAVVGFTLVCGEDVVGALDALVGDMVGPNVVGMTCELRIAIAVIVFVFKRSLKPKRNCDSYSGSMMRLVPRTCLKVT